MAGKRDRFNDYSSKSAFTSILYYTYEFVQNFNRRYYNTLRFYVKILKIIIIIQNNFTLDLK